LALDYLTNEILILGHLASGEITIGGPL